MLVQTREPFPVRCSRSWRIATLGGSAIALLLACGTLGLRPAHVQAAEPSDREPANTTSAPGRETTPADRPDGARTEGQPDTASAPARETTPADRPDGARTDDPNAERREAADQGHTTADPTADRPDPEGEHRNVTRESDDLRSAQMRMRDWLRSRPAGRPSTAQELTNDYASNPSTRMRGRPGQEVAPALSGAGGAAHAGLDLVSLANTYLDALGQERVAAARASITRGDSGPRDEAIAHAELANAEAKVRLLRRIIEVATQQADSELQRLQQLYRTGAVSSADLTDADTRAKILRLILEGGDNTAPREARPRNHIESRP